MTSRTKENAVLLLITLTSLVIVIIYLVNRAHGTYQGFFSYLIENSYRPHINEMKPLIVGGRPLYTYYYSIVLISFILAVTLKRLPSIPLFKLRSPQSLLVTSGFFALVLSLGLQSFTYVNAFTKEYRGLRGKSLHERQLILNYGKVYQFARHARLLLKDHPSAQLITDMDITTDPGMYIRNFLAYHLYPVDMRNIRGEPVDNLIIFRKKNALQSVPEDFEILEQIDEENIIAVKKRVNNAPQ